MIHRVLPLLFIATLTASVRAAPGTVTEQRDAARGAASDRHTGVRAYGFHFTRGAYTGFSRGRTASWAVDYPKADEQFVSVLARLTNVDTSPRENAVWLDDPELRRFPFLYVVEVGYMSLSEAEVRGLRDYLLAGGFLIVDDFWGSREWAVFEAQMARVLPEHTIVELPLEHPIFSIFYNIDEIVQVPAVNNVWGPTHERDGYVPHVRGIFDDAGRLMAIINWNTDLGDAWEWAEQPHYPLKYSTYAFRMGVNMVVYALSH